MLRALMRGGWFIKRGKSRKLHQSHKQMADAAIGGAMQLCSSGFAQECEQEWHPFTSGGESGVNGEVRAMTVWNGILIAAAFVVFTALQPAANAQELNHFRAFLSGGTVGTTVGETHFGSDAVSAEPAVHVSQQPPLRYFYLGEERPLTLNASQIALRIDEAVSEVQRDRWLARAGLSVEDLSPHGITPWHLALVPVDSRTEGGVRDAVARLAAEVGDDERFASPVFVDDLGGPLIVTPEILVQFHEDVAPEQAQAILAERGLDILETDWANMPGAYRTASASRNGFVVLEQANALAQRADTVYAEPDMIFSGRGATTPPNDPMFSSQWGLRNVGQSIGSPCFVSGGTPGMDMQVLDAWKVTAGDPSIIVVVIDTGVVLDHPDLMALPALGGDFTGENGGGWPVNFCDTHGTPVAGCVSAIKGNGIGVVGVAPGARLASARTFITNTDPCTGNWNASASWTVAALDWASSIGARVTNNSNHYGFQSGSIATKYSTTRLAGMVHFASAGNDSSANITYPASLFSVNAVAALNRFGNLASFSNWGTGLAFSAPGEHIITTANSGYTCFGGTSAASPYAAGVAALVLSANSAYTAIEVEDIMAASATDLGAPGYDTTFGWGMVNAAAALETQPPPPTPANNTCTSSVVVGVGQHSFTNLSATTNGPNEPLVCNFAGDEQVQSDIWYRHTATCTGNLTVSLCETSTDFDAKIALYGAICPQSNNAAIACNKDSCGNLPSLTIPVNQGQIIRIRIGGHDGAQGTGSFNITCDVPKEPPNCPADLNNSSTVDGFDLLLLLGAWGECPNPNNCPADLNNSSTVDGFDLLLLLGNWGPCP